MIQILLPLVALAIGSDNQTKLEHISFLKEFESPTSVSEEYLSYPQAMDFADDGRLYVVDANQSTVFVWDKAGKFLKTIIKKGKGPGELLFPQSLLIRGDRLYIMESGRQLISIFDLEGNFIKFTKTTGKKGKVFGVIDNGFIIAYKTFQWKSADGENDHRYWFDMLDVDGNQVKTLKWFKNTTYLAEERSKPWASLVDIQRGPNGNLYLGCSENTTLYETDATGRIVGETNFRIPVQTPTKEEEKWFQDLTFAMPEGGRSIANSQESDPVKFDFNSEKAYYTQFIIKGDKVAFVMTPLGDFNGMPLGFSRATYYVNDLKTGKTLERGEYAFPEDSVVFYRNCRIMAFIASAEADAFQIREITLKGL